MQPSTQPREKKPWREALQQAAPQFNDCVCFLPDQPRELQATLQNQPGLFAEEADSVTSRHFPWEALEYEAEGCIAITSATAHELPLAQWICHALYERGWLKEADIMRVSTALHEALSNAIQHGNLEISGQYDSLASFDDFHALMEQRLKQHYGRRWITISYRRLGDYGLHVAISDQGQGFSSLPDFTTGIDRLHGRGIQLMYAFTDNLQFEEGGKRTVLEFMWGEKVKQNSSRHNAHILIVEDTECGRELFKTMLEKQGYKHISLAHDGQHALEVIAETPPDIILLDLMMPRLDGFAFCKKMQSLSKYKNLPIIAVTIMEDLERRIAILKAGASDLVIKPVPPLELDARIKLHLDKADMLRQLHQYRSKAENDLSRAHQMQLSLMPSAQDMELWSDRYKLQIDAYFQASEHIGGDFWALLPISSTELGIVLCDFAGHGVTAAIQTFRLHAMVQQFPAQELRDPGKYLTRLNENIYPLLAKHEFATMLVGCFNIEQDRFYYSAAANPPPLLIEPGKAMQQLDTAGLPLGVMRWTKYDTRQCGITPESMLLFYSDALIESPMKDGALLQLESIVETWHGCDPATPTEIIKQLLKQLGIIEGALLQDDLTLAALKYTQEAARVIQPPPSTRSPS